ncbi:cell morphogenesis N-terminal-domain-containing protein [Dipodascopsis uninucleata]
MARFEDFSGFTESSSLRPVAEAQPVEQSSTFTYLDTNLQPSSTLSTPQPVETDEKSVQSLPVLKPQHPLLSHQNDSSVHASSFSMASSVTSLTPSHCGFDPNSSVTAAQQSPTTSPPSVQSSHATPKTPPRVEMRRQISLNKPQLNRSFSLGGVAARRNQAMPGSPFGMTPPMFRQNSNATTPLSLNGPSSQEPITPAEYALHIVFTQFVRHAEKKLNMCLSYSIEDEPPITSLLGSGVDPVFDKILASLGYIARQKPRPVIDAVMFWRKSKSEAATAAAREKIAMQQQHQQLLQQQQSMQTQQASALPGSVSGLRHKVSKSLSDRSTGNRTFVPPISQNGHSYHRHHYTLGNILSPISNGAAMSSKAGADNVQQADRKSLISIYILCRVLIEVVRQTSAHVLGDEMGDKLEEIVFRQIKSADINLLNTSVIRAANWNLFAELLGEMSRLRFTSVSDRFIAELEKVTGDSMTKEQEVSIQLLIHGMKYLKLTVYPMDCFEDSADFIKSVAKFFTRSHGQRIKQAYCEVLNQLLLSIAGVVTAEVNHPTWVSAISICYPKAINMLSKQRYWQYAYPLACTLLCVAPVDYFTENWVSLLDMGFAKLKDKSCRVIVINCITRMMWVYLRRCTESLNNATKRLDYITRMLFGSSLKKNLLSGDPAIIEGCVQLVRFIGATHQDYALRNIVFPLLGSDSFSSQSLTDMTDTQSPERMQISTRAFLWILHDAVKNIAPPFYVKETSSQITSQENSDTLDILNTPTNPTLKDYYQKFSQVLSKIVLTCDSKFGNQLQEERALYTPKSANSSFSFSGSNGYSTGSAGDTLHANYELLLTLFDAIPHCVPSLVSPSKIVEMLCKGTIHFDERVSISAANSLKALAKSGKYPAQTIVTGFARFAFNFDEKFSILGDSDDSIPDVSVTVENNLRLYVELLNIWINLIREKTAEHREQNANIGQGDNLQSQASNATSDVSSSNRGEEMETTSVWSVIEEVESNGLFFLCSQSRIIRRYAILVLRLIREFDSALNEQVEVLKMSPKRSPVLEDMARIIDVLESSDGCGVLDIESQPSHIFDSVSAAERSRLVKLQQDSKNHVRRGILLKLAESDSGIDSAIWLRIFPNLLTVCLSKFPMPVALCRNSVCARLLHMQKNIIEITESYQKSSLHMIESFRKHSMRTKPEVFIEQWKLYLIVACSTITATDDQEHSSKTATIQTRRKGAAQLAVVNKRITSAKSLFRIIIPLLQVDCIPVREAVMAGLGCINVNLYRTLVESLQPMISSMSDNRKQGSANVNQQTVSPAGSLPWRRNRKQDWVRAEVAHVLQLTSHFLEEPSIFQDSWIIEQHVAFIKDCKIFLSHQDVQVDWECQKLRRYFCGFIQVLYESIQLTPDPSKWFPFEARVSCFRLIEEWCGYGQYSYLSRERNDKMKKSAMDLFRDVGEQGVIIASIELEKDHLELAALNAMASLLKGPLTEAIESYGTQTAIMSFDVPGIFTWSHSVFQSVSERLHIVGRRAIINLLKSNPDHKSLLQRTISFSYGEEQGQRARESYFYAVADVLTEMTEYPCEVRQPMALGLFKIGDEKSEVRVKAAALLRAVEYRFFGKSSVQDYEISISDRTTAVYKRAQFNLANKFALDYSELTYQIFSELTMFFTVVIPTSRRDMLAIMIPWISTMELQLDPGGKDPSPSAYMVMTNLFDITVRFSDRIQNEIEALWVTLASGRHLGNVRAILDFIINSSVERRDPSFVEYGKQIVVYLASTPAGSKLVEALIAYIQPTSMLPTGGESRDYNGIEEQYPYIADLSQALPASNRQIGFSIGQLAMILLVDLLVTPVAAMSESLALLLQVVFVLLDHYNQLVHEQARELLVHLIHVLILPADSEVDGERKNSTVELIDMIRRRDSKTIWSYDDLYTDEVSMRSPKNMGFLVKEVLEIFTTKYPSLGTDWSRIALTWATTCPVRHFACRSFQIFRLSFVTIDQNMLADMLVRLSNTVADANPDIQNFAMQILMTLNAIVTQVDVSDLVNYPQIFWATVACLNTIHEQEFVESLTILEVLLDRFSLADADVVSLFMSVFPAKWEGKFEGLQKTILPGLRSSRSYDQSMRVLDKLNYLELNEITGNSMRLLYAVLANLPRFLHALEIGELSSEIILAAEQLAHMAEHEEMTLLSKIMTSISKGNFRIKDDFIRQIVHALQSTVFHEHEASTMVFMLGLLSNKLSFVRIEAMEFLRYLFPLVDMRRPEFVVIGADLISPLLRLLQTEFAEQALQVLDEATYIPGTQMDRHVLRASLGGRSAINRKEDYENTAMTFGIPDEDGWSVPMPALRASLTRSNVHAVFYSCDVSNQEYNALDPNMTVQFSRDEYTYTGLPSADYMRHHASQLAVGISDGGYFGGAFGVQPTTSTAFKNTYFGADRADTMVSFAAATATEEADGSLSHMVAALDNLNSFFAEEPTAYSNALE